MHSVEVALSWATIVDNNATIVLTVISRSSNANQFGLCAFQGFLESIQVVILQARIPDMPPELTHSREPCCIKVDCRVRNRVKGFENAGLALHRFTLQVYARAQLPPQGVLRDRKPRSRHRNGVRNRPVNNEETQRCEQREETDFLPHLPPTHEIVASQCAVPVPVTVVLIT